jgi:hypothetical protein
MNDLTPDATSVVLAHLAELRGIPEDDWTEGTAADLGLRLHRLRVLEALVHNLAAAVEQTLVDSMEEDTVVVTGVGPVRRTEKNSSRWKSKDSADRLRADLSNAVANSVAIDVATGDIDPMKRNVARATMSLALEAIPAFSSLNKAGRERLGLYISDYRDYATSYHITIESIEDDR